MVRCSWVIGILYAGTLTAAEPAIDGNSAPLWKPCTGWVTSHPLKYGVANEKGALVFTAEGTGTEMPWIVELKHFAVTGNERYLVVRYRATGMSTDPNIYFLHGEEGSYGGQNYAKADALVVDGQWHMLAVDLVAIEPLESTHHLAVKVFVAGRPSAKLTIESIRFVDRLPEGARIAPRRRAPLSKAWRWTGARQERFSIRRACFPWRVGRNRPLPASPPSSTEAPSPSPCAARERHALAPDSAGADRLGTSASRGGPLQGIGRSRSHRVCPLARRTALGHRPAGMHPAAGRGSQSRRRLAQFVADTVGNIRRRRTGGRPGLCRRRGQHDPGCHSLQLAASPVESGTGVGLQVAQPTLANRASGLRCRTGGHYRRKAVPVPCPATGSGGLVPRGEHCRRGCAVCGPARRRPHPSIAHG